MREHHNVHSPPIWPVGAVIIIFLCNQIARSQFHQRRFSTHAPTPADCPRGALWAALHTTDICMHRHHTSAAASSSSVHLPHAANKHPPPSTPAARLQRRRLAPLHHNRPLRAMQAVQDNSEIEFGGTPTKRHFVAVVKGQFGHRTRIRYRHYSGL
jgi:hypothetical protein